MDDTSARGAATAILDWMGTFGSPSEIVSDNGTQLANETIKQLSEIGLIENLQIHAYSKEENAIVERANKEVKRHLTSIVFHTK
jgi:hypothetical protein